MKTPTKTKTKITRKTYVGDFTKFLIRKKKRTNLYYTRWARTGCCTRIISQACPFFTLKEAEKYIKTMPLKGTRRTSWEIVSHTIVNKITRTTTIALAKTKTSKERKQ